MQRLALLGIVLTLIGVSAYITGVFVQYPGRGFSITVVMIGLTLFGVGGLEGQVNAR